MIITRTPLRIGLVGGGTDLPAFCGSMNGITLSCAIDKYVDVIIREAFDDGIYLNYSRKEIVSDVSEVEHDLIREAMRLTGVIRGVNITTLSDIPSEGSGLGSSSAVTVGLLNALHAYRGEQVPAADLAEQACEIEIDRCGKPIGRQDQHITALGGIQRMFFMGKHVQANEIHLSPGAYQELQQHIMLFYTGVTRSADTILSSQRMRMEFIHDHFRQLRGLAESAIPRLSKEGAPALGEAVRKSWEFKRKLGGGVTNEEIERAVASALDAGASGAKICGAGGGGYLLVICPPAAQENVRTVLAPMKQMPAGISKHGTRILLNVT